MTPAEQKEANRQKAKQQHAARLAEVQPSPEVARLKAAESRANEARRSKLSHVDRELEDAQKSAHEAEQRAADDQRRESIKTSPAYISTRDRLNDLVFSASFDPSVSAGQLTALQAELESLEESQDISTVRSNLREIQSAIAAKLEVESAQLKASQDAIANRKTALGSGLIFDDLSVEVLGETPYVALTINGETKRVTQARFDARTSDESLRDSLFQTGVSNV